MQRKTQAEAGSSAAIPTDKAEIVRIESLNALKQFDWAMDYVRQNVHQPQQFTLKPSLLTTLNRLATEGTNRYPGVLRPGNVTIEGSGHVPPPFELVPELVEDICDYINKHRDKPPIHLAAYLLWRVNWVHPFADGNGRTSRMISYVVLCISLGFELPGTNTIPEQIANDKDPYYMALEHADAAFAKDGSIEVGALEGLLSKLLATQLVQLHDKATGGH